MAPLRRLRELGGWLDERTGWRGVLLAWRSGRAPSAGPVSSTLDALAAASFIVLMVTGVALSTAYAPSPPSAWASVHYIGYIAPGGWLVRGMHAWAAQAIIALTAARVAEGAIVGVYRKPREIAWWLTLVVVMLVLGEAMTGALLPWDQRGWWARAVEGSIVGLVPLVGSWVERTMFAGPEPSALALSRAHALHVIVLPLAIGAASWGRRKLLGRDRWNAERYGDTSALVALSRQAVVGLFGLLCLLALTVATHGWPLEAPADPTSHYPARPEWYLSPLFELRKLFEGPCELWATIFVPMLAAAYLALLPWLDVPHGSPAVRRGPIAVAVIFGGVVALTGLATVRDAHDASFTKQRAAAERRALTAIAAAMQGVPPGGPLEMVRHDPELHGEDLYEKHCAACHVLGDLGDPKNATGAKLDGWATPEWNAAMMHDPDAPEYFGRGPFKGQMYSVDERPRQLKPWMPWRPLIHDAAELRAVALLLAALGDEPGDPPHEIDPAQRALGENILTQRCSSCHLYQSKGDEDGSRNAPELSGYGSVAWTRAQIENPSSPETYRADALENDKNMPRFDSDLSRDDIDVLARWTRAHARGLSLGRR